MQYPHLFTWSVNSGAAAKYATPFIGMNESNGTIANSQISMPVGGTFSRLSVTNRTALTGSQSRTFALLINGSAGALVVVHNSGTGVSTVSDLSNTDTVSAGDLVEWRVLGNSAEPADTFEVCFEFEAASGTNLALHSHGAGDVLANNARASLLYSEGDWDTGGTTANRGIAAVDGTITHFTERLTAAPGGGNSRTFTIFKNNVAQDGSGGTPDTRITFGAADTVLSTTFSLSVSAGDDLCIQQTQSGSPTSARSSGVVAFQATDTDTWNVGFWSGFGPSTGTTYQLVVGGSNTGGGWQATEADVSITNGPTPFILSHMRVVWTGTAPTDSFQFFLRLNGANTALTVTITSPATSGEDVTHSVQISDGDVLNTSAVEQSSANVVANCAIVFGANLIQASITSFVVGVDTTVTATRAFAVGLDGNTNTLAEEGKMKVFGAFEATGTVTLTSGAVNISEMFDGLGT